MTDSLDKRHQLLMEILLEAILRREPIAYKDVTASALRKNKELGQRMHYRFVLPGLLGELNRLIGSSLPTISSLVVNKRTRFPGPGISGFPGFRSWKKLDDKKDAEKKSVMTARVQNYVFAYKQWDKIYENLFGDEPPPLNRGNNQGKRGSGGEGRKHRDLKKYIANHPEKLGINDNCLVDIELSLPSGDKVDVVFSSRTKTILVEVKSHISPDDDLRRGIYQCVKYRSVCSAWWLKQLDVSKVSFVSVVLVTERKLPTDAEVLARKLKVKHLKVKLPKKR